MPTYFHLFALFSSYWPRWAPFSMVVCCVLLITQLTFMSGGKIDFFFFFFPIISLLGKQTSHCWCLVMTTESFILFQILLTPQHYNQYWGEGLGYMTNAVDQVDQLWVQHGICVVTVIAYTQDNKRKYMHMPSRFPLSSSIIYSRSPSISHSIHV